MVVGADEKAAEIVLQARYEQVTGLRLESRAILVVGDCQPGDYIYRVSRAAYRDGALVGHDTPRESAYLVEPHNPIVCSGAYDKHITCRNSSGILVPVAPDMECILQ